MPEQWDVKHLYSALNEGLKVNSGDRLCEVRIPTQPIPKELLEMEEPKKEILIRHPEERMLWLQQRIAGTNEQWRVRFKGSREWLDIPVHREPLWQGSHEYEIKPKTVKYYFCLCRKSNGIVDSILCDKKDVLITILEYTHATIIGNIEERDVVV